MGNPLLLVIGVVMGASMLYFWYCEMFSDGFMGSFNRAFNSRRGKNFIALSQPAAGLTACFGCIAALGTVIDPHVFQRGRNGFPFWEIWGLFWGIPTVLCTFLIFVGFIPFSLPEWMYPEYHAAKREEQRRREAAERGESEDSENRFPFLDDDGVYASQLGHIAIDIPEAVGLLRTSHGARPTRAHRRPQDGGDAPTARSILVQTDNAEDPEQPSTPSEASSTSSQAQSSAESSEESSDHSPEGA